MKRGKRPKRTNCGGMVKSVRAVTLVAGDVHAHNSFKNPRAVEPKTDAVSARGAIVTHNLPPASVIRLETTLV